MKILIVHASAGAGHKKAAEALFAAIQKSTPYSSTLVDILDYTSPRYKKIYQGSYNLLVKKFPLLWGFFFWITDLSGFRELIRNFRRLYNSFNAKPFERFLEKEQFDCILSTHFFSNEVAAHLKRNNLIRSKIISVVTDFDVHTLWIAEGIDSYAVACEYTRDRLRSFGIGENKIVTTGIPTDEKFSKTPDKDELKEKLGLKKGVFTALLAAGSFGFGPMEAIAARLTDCQVLVVCGHNKELFQKLTEKKTDHVKPYGLVDNMDELMAVSDIMVTKPGGLSIAEALVKNLPLIFFSAISGQETNNVKILKKYGVGIDTSGMDAIVAEVQKMKNSKEYFAWLKKNIQRLARPSSVQEIIKLIS